MLGRAVAVVVLASTYALAAPGDKLYINGDNVNVRSGPGLTFQVVVQLDKGRELAEVARQDDWIHVSVVGSESQDGWVHAPLVATVAPTTPPADPKFSEFRHAVISMNASARQRVGAIYFDHMVNLGNGIVQLRATGTWLGEPKAERQSNLASLFDMWNTARGTVRIVDQSGQLVMEKNER